MADFKEYHVSWTITLLASSPTDAAQQAQAIQRNNSDANFFEIIEMGGDGSTIQVDLDALDEDEDDD